MKNLKSSYFIKRLFACLCEKQKLKLVKCNKSLQKNLDISLNNYKYYIDRYIIYESNGIGEEYDGYNDTKIFEIEYLNGKRNEKGKELWNYILIFEGEYLFGKGK